MKIQDEETDECYELALRALKSASRFGGAAYKDECWIPEYSLLQAILIRAVQDFTRLHAKAQDGSSRMISSRESERAREWIFDDPMPYPPFTFLWICEALDIDVVKARGNILKLRQQAEKFGPIHRSEALTMNIKIPTPYLIQ